MDLHPGRNVYPTSWFILFVLLLTGIAMCVIPTHVRDLLLHGPPPCLNVYQTSCFILSVLFLTGGKTSVVPTYVLDPPSKGLPPWYEHLPDQLINSVCVVFNRR